ncbi:acyl-CoA dehydrogenase family protein [Comamonas humi]
MPLSPGGAADNQFDELRSYHLLDTDPALQAALARAGADAWLPGLREQGRALGEADSWRQAELANRHTPELHRYDARGRRIDQVEFHPAWHRLLELYRAPGLIDRPFADEAPGRWTAWAAGFYLHGQLEPGSLCPATMTTASIPVLRREPALWAGVQAALTSASHDARDAPIAHKQALWVGMGMTEKQGGSDVRANTTTAWPVDAGGRGGAYRLRGHKWFFSVPMADAHLVVARQAASAADDGFDAPLACFWVPRWRPDGTRNAVQVLRLKDKVGNRSNASSEVEFDDAHAVLVGEPGRGIATIMEMATITRLCCVLGSAALLRQAAVQALAYARRRQAFGRPLAQHPAMQAVLADLALESEAALLLGLQLAQAFEHAGDPADPASQAWQRIMTPAAKFWVCKRAIAASAEAMEVLGGNGYVEPSVLARLYREAPVNSIWEGSGNLMCLDVLRALQRAPESWTPLRASLLALAQGDGRIAAAVEQLTLGLQAGAAALETQARLWVQQLVLAAQAGLMRTHAPVDVAEAFITSRLAPGARLAVIGALPAGGALPSILQRAFPE